MQENQTMERWREYFSELLNEQNKHQLDEEGEAEGPLKEITEGEVKSAIKAMKQGKAAGPTGLTSPTC